jgi:hypothetical protein
MMMAAMRVLVGYWVRLAHLSPLASELGLPEFGTLGLPKSDKSDFG